MHTIVPGPASASAATASFLRCLQNLFVRPVKADFDFLQELAKGELSHMVLPKDLSLECVVGSLWITSDEGGPDIILAAGDHMKISRQTSILVEALQESRMVLHS